MKAGTLLLVLILATASSLAGAHDDTEEEEGILLLPCGTPPRSAIDRKVEQMRLEGRQQQPEQRRELSITSRYEDLCDQCIEIDVHVHLVLAQLEGLDPFIPHPLNTTIISALNESVIEDIQELVFSTQEDIFELVNATIDVTNQSFRGTPFRFRWVPENTRTAINTDWSNYAYDHLSAISNTLGSNDRRIMDVYLLWQLRSSQIGTRSALGAAIVASLENEALPYGVWMRYDVLTRGGLRRDAGGRVDTGHTLVHEAGHWLGLEHTFASDFDANNTCNQADNNDYLEDTPQQAGPSNLFYETCTAYFNDTLERLDTCPDLPGNDLVFNYMNYVDTDTCWEERGFFTPDQIVRMYRHFLLYRDFTTVCEDPSEMEIEIIFVWDEDHFRQNWIRLIEDDSGAVVWNSNTDFRGELGSLLQESSMIDLCVPKTSTYILDVYDSFGDGFTDGRIAVYRDGVLLETLEGSFPRQVRVRIERLVTDSPTAPPTVSPTLFPTTRYSPTSQPTQAPTFVPTEQQLNARNVGSSALRVKRAGVLMILLLSCICVFTLGHIGT